MSDGALCGVIIHTEGSFDFIALIGYIENITRSVGVSVFSNKEQAQVDLLRIHHFFDNSEPKFESSRNNDLLTVGNSY